MGRGLLLIGLLTAVGGAAFLLLSSGGHDHQQLADPQPGSQAGPADQAGQRNHSPIPGQPGTGGLDRSEDLGPDRSIDATPISANESDADQDGELGAKEGDPPAGDSLFVEVQVRLKHALTGEPIEPFKITLLLEPPPASPNLAAPSRPTASHPQKTVWEEATQGMTIRPSPGSANLLVEAEGFTPTRWEGQLAAGAESPVQIELFAQPAARNAGLTVIATDSYGQPVPTLRVQVTPTSPPGSKPLWLRENTTGDGRHILPELPPGTYTVDAWAVDTTGFRLPLTTFRARNVVFTGSEGIELNARLNPASLLEVIVQDNTGRHLGQEIGLKLSGPPGIVAPDTWIGMDRGYPLGQVRGLPCPGPAKLDGSLIEGSWRLDVFREGKPVATRELQLAVGQENQVVIRLP